MLLIDSGSSEPGSGNTYRFQFYSSSIQNTKGIFVEALVARCEYDALYISSLIMPDLPVLGVSVRLSTFPVYRNGYTDFTFFGTKERTEGGMMTIKFEDNKLKMPFHIKGKHDLTVTLLDPICPIVLPPVNISGPITGGNVVNIPAHGLTTGDMVEYLVGCDRKKEPVTVIDADTFSVPDTIVNNYLDLTVSNRRFVFTLRFE